MRHTITKDGDLLILADNQDRQELSDLYANGRGYLDAYGYVESCLESYGIASVEPEDIGALTDAPILTDGRAYPDHPGKEPVLTPDANVWWFPDYQVIDPFEELKNKGRVCFTRAQPDN